jgi:Holliday junction resolvase RusA-like endonuclease
MIQLEIYGDLIPWAAPQKSRGRFYDPNSLRKDQIKWQIRAQYRGELLAGATILEFTFFYPIPKATSKIKRKQMLNGVIVPTVTPDCSNLIKCYEDCLKGIVIEDDRIVCDILAKRRYADVPSVLIRIMTYQEKYGGIGC